MKENKLYFLDGKDRIKPGIIGKKGEMIHRMATLGIPVPYAFVITPDLTREILDTEEVCTSLMDAIKKMGIQTKKEFGSEKNPLLLALRVSLKEPTHFLIPEIFNIGGIKEIELGINLSQTSYRQLKKSIQHIAGITTKIENKGISIIVQEMVGEGLDNRSGTGMFYSINPSGKKDLYGFYAHNAQVYEMFYTANTPYPISILQKRMPYIYEELKKSSEILRKNFKEPLEVCFIVEKGKLYIWNCSIANLPIFAHSDIFINMVEQGILTKEEGVLSIDTSTLRKFLFKELSITNRSDHVDRGIPVSPGIVSGRIVFSSIDVEKYNNDPMILVKELSVPKDVMMRTSGLITASGSATSHAAIVAKNIGKCCIVGVNNLKIDREMEKIDLNGTIINKGDWITIDGTSGKIFKGKIDVAVPGENPNIEVFSSWLRDINNEIRPNLKVLVNCNHPETALKALNYGAEGIGLLRTENLFLSEEHNELVKRVLHNPNINKDNSSLIEIGEILRRDIKKILIAMDDKPVIIRLFDFRLHEVFSHTNGDRSQKDFAQMPWWRGVRLLIKYRLILEMQIQSIFESAIEIKKGGGIVNLSILLPLVMNKEEVFLIKDEIRKISKRLFEQENVEINYQIGIMVEQPRTAYIMNQIAREVDFISFGTNDLTQLTFGLSRDDFEQIIRYYLAHDLMENDPFRVIDEDGVGGLIKTAVQNARKENPGIQIGVCGEHAGNPESIDFFIRNNFDHISCSLNDLLIARLSATQKQIKNNLNTNFIEFNENKLFHDSCMERINRKLDLKIYSQAQGIALEWAKTVSKKYSLEEPVVWKFFKRDVATKWFGRIEHKKFYPNWSVKEVMEYIDSFSGKSFRISIFTHDIACHAVSHYFPVKEKNSWMKTLSGIDNTSSIRVFPVPAYENMCFRLFYSGEEFYVEAGIGEAMYVFESAQGKHPIILFKLQEGAELSDENISWKYTDGIPVNRLNDLKKRLKKFIKIHRDNLQIRFEMILNALGIDYISIEGYFDINNPEQVEVVDLDLPQDVAFMSQS